MQGKFVDLGSSLNARVSGPLAGLGAGEGEGGRQERMGCSLCDGWSMAAERSLSTWLLEVTPQRFIRKAVQGETSQGRWIRGCLCAWRGKQRRPGSYTYSCSAGKTAQRGWCSAKPGSLCGNLTLTTSLAGSPTVHMLQSSRGHQVGFGVQCISGRAPCWELSSQASVH